MATWIFESKDATVWIGNSVTAVTTSTLYSQSTASTNAKNYTPIIRSVKFTPGASSVDKIDTFGITSGTVVTGGYYPNQYMVTNKPDMASFEITWIPQGEESTDLFGATASTSAGAGQGIRCIGQSVTSVGARRKLNVMALESASTTQWKSVLMNNAVLDSIDRSLNLDGAEEETVTFKALNVDCYAQNSGSFS